MTVSYIGRTLLSWEDDATEFVVEEPFTAKWDRGLEHWSPVLVFVPAGFTTDLASIPRVFQSIVPKLGHHIRPAIVHDYCYEGHTDLTRKEADAMFLDGMKSTKVNFVRRWAMWAAVRVGGTGKWD